MTSSSRSFFRFVFILCMRRKKINVRHRVSERAIVVVSFLSYVCFSPYDLVSVRGCFKAPTGSVVFFCFAFSLQLFTLFAFLRLLRLLSTLNVRLSSLFHDATPDSVRKTRAKIHYCIWKKSWLRVRGGVYDSSHQFVACEMSLWKFIGVMQAKSQGIKLTESLNRKFRNMLSDIFGLAGHTQIETDLNVNSIKLRTMQREINFSWK